MNRSQGTILNIHQKEILHILTLDVNNTKLKVFTLQLNECFKTGIEVEILFKETAPLLVKGDMKVLVSAANSIPVTVKNISYGELFAEVDLESAIGLFTSLLTMEVVKSFDLNKGNNLMAYIKASDISIGKIEDG